MILKICGIWGCTALLGASVACAGPADQPAPAEATAGQDSVVNADAPTLSHEWALTSGGAGPVRIGMSIGDLQPLLAAAPDTTALGSECAYVQIAGAPQGMGFMMVGGNLVRIDVSGGSTPTAEGATIGDSEARVMELYPTAVRSPHKYTDGAYLVVTPGAPADTITRFVFETDGSMVTRYRAGLAPHVEWVEGCS